MSATSQVKQSLLQCIFATAILYSDMFTPCTEVSKQDQHPDILYLVSFATTLITSEEFQRIMYCLYVPFHSSLLHYKQIDFLL